MTDAPSTRLPPEPARPGPCAYCQCDRATGEGDLAEFCADCAADIRAVRLAYREFPEILDDERDRRFWAEWYPAIRSTVALERARERGI